MISDRLDLLKRKNAGLRLLPELKRKLSVALRIDSAQLSFFSLEQSDEIRERIARSFPPRNELERHPGDYPFVSKRVRSTAASKLMLPIEEGDVLLVFPEADKVGILPLSGTILNARWSDLLDAEPDGCVLVNLACSEKFVIEKGDDESGSEDSLRLAAWGNEWAAVLGALNPV